MMLVAALPLLALATPLAACSEGPEANAAARSRLSCSAVRSEHLKDREWLNRRVEQARAAEKAARKGGKSELARDRAFQELMADIERTEGRYAARSKDCVGD